MEPLLGLVMLVVVLILDFTKGDLLGVRGTLLTEGGGGRGAVLVLNCRTGGGGGKGFSVSELCFSIAG